MTDAEKIAQLEARVEQLERERRELIDRVTAYLDSRLLFGSAGLIRAAFFDKAMPK